MREYILYVIVVFIPIAIVMARLLKNNGLPAKNISFIIMVSLLIIITFPISMARLSLPVSIILYLILLFIIGSYLVRFDEGYTLGTEGGYADGENDTRKNEAEINNGAADKLAVALSAAGTEAEGLNQVNVSFEQLTESSADDFYNTTYIADAGKEEPDQDYHTEDAAYISTQEQLHSELLTYNEDVTGGSAYRDEPLNSNDITNEFSEEVSAFLTEFEYEPSIQKDNEGEVLIQETVNDDIVQETEMEDDLENSIIDEEINAITDEPDIMINNSVAVAEESMEENLIEDNEIIKEVMSLVDKGFASKIDNNYKEASEYFYQAWSITEDKDLTYLLTIELVEIYKNLGFYSKAEEILIKFGEKQIYGTDITDSINEQLMFIRLIRQETARLGIAELPFNDLPRWIKLKVEEEIEQDNR